MRPTHSRRTHSVQDPIFCSVPPQPQKESARRYSSCAAFKAKPTQANPTCFSWTLGQPMIVIMSKLISSQKLLSNSIRRGDRFYFYNVAHPLEKCVDLCCSEMYKMICKSFFIFTHIPFNALQSQHIPCLLCLITTSEEKVNHEDCYRRKVQRQQCVIYEGGLVPKAWATYTFASALFMLNVAYAFSYTCCHPSHVFFTDASAYFSKTTPSRILSLCCTGVSLPKKGASTPVACLQSRPVANWCIMKRNNNRTCTSRKNRKKFPLRSFNNQFPSFSCCLKERWRKTVAHTPFLFFYQRKVSSCVVYAPGLAVAVAGHWKRFGVSPPLPPALIPGGFPQILRPHKSEEHFRFGICSYSTLNTHCLNC